MSLENATNSVTSSPVLQDSKAPRAAPRQTSPGEDGPANAHTLGHIDPRRLARRLVIFTPTGDEIDRLVDRAREDIPGLGPNESVHRVISHNPDSFWAIARRDQFNSRGRNAEGFQAFLMLNEAGLKELTAGTFKGTAPDTALLAAQNEKPAGIYIWCTHAWGSLSGGMSLSLQKISTPVYRDVDVFSTASTPEGARTLEGLGFVLATDYPGVARDDLWVYRRAAPPKETPPIYDEETSNSREKTSITVARSMEDLARVFSIRSAVYLAEQACPYEEEFDGNDLSATHLLGYAGRAPVACLRIRYFADFAKLERLAVRYEFRGMGLAKRMIQAGIEMCRVKGYTRIYGQSEDNLVNWYGQFGFRVPNESRKITFSELGFVEIVLDVPRHPDAISMDADPYVIIRPEGQWHKPGILEASAGRPVTQTSLSRPHA